MRRWLRRVALVCMLIAALAAVAFAFAPWRPWLEARITRAIKAKGFGPAALTIGKVGLRGVTLESISVGGVMLKQVQLGYALRDLMDGQLDTLDLSGLEVAITRDTEGWRIGDWRPPPPAADAAPARIPVDATFLAGLPLRALALHDTTVQLALADAKAELKGSLTADLQPSPKFEYRSDAWQGSTTNVTLTTGAVAFDGALTTEPAQWKGTWSIVALSVVQEAVALPPLDCSGTWEAVADAVSLTGKCASADKQYGAQFSLDYHLADATKSRLRVARASLPWSGGVLAVRDANVPLASRKPIRLQLLVEEVAIAGLMQSLTGDKATATGTVSGVLPITLMPDGKIRFAEASLDSAQPGIIALTPETIPGDHPQVNLVRDVLKNLHYNLLSLQLNTAPDESLAVVLMVEGRNPDIEGGRPVKLKVQLSGDVLGLLQKNLLLMSAPQTFLRKETDAKP